ncbi:hypothetical protein GCM10009332_27320 [Shewanella gelidii]|uniref:DUF2066 domain-containing protein n=1 Tax=Shewanella gelidii TaxID=1642821 RepID=A0A917NCI4_9GAMM|nr:hypothetical protein GCM10009332_27320 [Shewanella gelidii]
MLYNLLKRLSVALLIILSATPLAGAVEVSDLEQTDIKVDSRDRALRNAALTEALKRVYVKNSGTVQVLQNEFIQTSVKSPRRYLSQFRYFDLDGQLMLRAIFDHGKVLETLRQAQSPIWGTQRPLTLVWLVSENDQQRQLIGDASESEDRALFKSSSVENAIPTTFPLLDLDDLMVVSESDVRGLFVDVVGKASHRYQTDFFSMATIESHPSGFRYQMDLYPYGSEGAYVAPLNHIEGVAKDKPEAVEALVLGLSRYYSQRYAIKESDQQNSMTISFANVSDMRKLVAIERYFSELSAVKSIQISQIQGTQVTFNVSLFGTEADLLNVLRLETRIGEWQGYSNTSGDQNNSQQGAPVDSASESPMFIWQNRG